MDQLEQVGFYPMIAQQQRRILLPARMPIGSVDGNAGDGRTGLKAFLNKLGFERFGV